MNQLETSLNYSLFALDHESVIAAAQDRFKELEIEDPSWVADVYVIEASESINSI